jgi:acetolactate synthase-1/2/3 large subunit
MTVADFIADALVRAGVRHTFGVGGANIEDLFAAIQRRRPAVLAVLGKHEHGAATAADAYARLTGGVGVVMATSGGGTMNLVHGLAEARASRVPLLAILGEPPSDVQGQGAFQDSSGRGGALDAVEVLRGVSVFCARLASPADVGVLLTEAWAAAQGPLPGPAVLLVAKDRQRAPVPAGATPAHLPRPAAGRPAGEIPLGHAERMLAARPVVVLAGDEVARAGAGPELARLVSRLDARVAVAPDARDAFANDDPRFLGVAGAMGHPAVARALDEASVVLVVGTRLPLLARQGLERVVRELPRVCVSREPPFVSSGDTLHLEGDLTANLRALLARLGGEVPAPPPPVAAPSGGVAGAGTGAVLASVARTLPPDGVVLVDAGNTGAQAIHHLRLPRGARWLVAMGMAGMGWTFGAAVGAAFATGRRCTVLAGDGAFFMHGLDVHTAIEHRLPITYVILNNRAHGMCVVREQLLLGAESGYNRFGPSRIGAGLAAMFPGLRAEDCGPGPGLAEALARVGAGEGPGLIAVDLPEVEVPPFVAFARAVPGQAAPAGGGAR